MNTRRRLLMSQAVQSAPVTTDNYVAGDIAFYDSTDDKIVLVHNEDITTDTYPIDRYTPIGVVVIPNSHDVYGDGSCGVMSLKAMNCDTPATGSTSEQQMYWGVYDTGISGLPNLSQVSIGNTLYGIPTGSTLYGYLPGDKFSGTRCAHDEDVYYRSTPYIPSPYLTDGSRNSGYYQTSSPSSSINALADFDGRGNTDKIIAQRGIKDYTSWKPTFDFQTDYPAASCCDMFHTEGTQQGDWYLPACGELGYIIPPLNKINYAIDKIRTAYGSSVGVRLNSINEYHWSSTQYSSGLARYVNTNRGEVNSYNKNYYGYVRAWLRVKPDGTITSRTTTS